MRNRIVIVTLLTFSSWLHGEVLSSGPLAGVDLDTQCNDETRPILRKANEDCIEIEALRLPKYAEPFPTVIRDGGSRVFVGDGYTILLRRTFFPVMTREDRTIRGASYGYELYLFPYDYVQRIPGLPSAASKVWYVPEAELARITEGYKAELKARTPPLEKYYRLEKVEAEEAEPSATDNPGDAQRLREDH